MLLHASCAARGPDAVLLLGPPGSGKSDLVLRLIADAPAGWRLVADDQVELAVRDGALRPSAPAALRGMLEVRGVGLFRGLETAPAGAALRLAVRLVPRAEVPRLPTPASWACEGVALPAIALHAFDASAPAKVALAMAAATGAAGQAAGAFAA